jgi:peptidyl-prolyl cis-trans isomerase A (cyclophilin A)
MGGRAMSMTKVRTVAMVVWIFASLAAVLPASSQQKTAPKSAADPVIALDTTMGMIKVQLLATKAPITTKNFLEYVNSGFYDGTIVHRVDFVIGFGGYTETMMPKSAFSPIKNESKNGLKNLRGTLAMARFSDPDSATSQFFINLQNNDHLDPSGGAYGYAVFGKVIEGMEVVDRIAKVKTGNKGSFSNIPAQTITVKSAKVLSR